MTGLRAKAGQSPGRSRYNAPSSWRRSHEETCRVRARGCFRSRAGGAVHPGRVRARARGHAGRRSVRLAALPADRAGLDVGPHLAPGRLRGQPGDLLRRHRPRRRLEDRQQRDHLRGAAAGPGPDVHRGRGGLAVQPGPGLGGHGGVQQPPEHVLGRRDLQVRGWRQDVREHGAARIPSHPPGGDRPARQQHRVCRGHREPVGAGWRARRLQDGRRGAHLEAGAEGGRRHGRERPGDRPLQQQDPLRLDLPAPADGVGHEWRRAGQRPLEVHRRRRDMDPPGERNPVRAPGPNRG